MPAASSAQANNPQVDPNLFYDGPEPNVVRPNFAPIISDEERQPRNRADYVAMLTATVDILAARLLALIAVVGAVMMFGWAVYDPQPWRVYASVSYAVVVLWPLVYLHLRKG